MLRPVLGILSASGSSSAYIGPLDLVPGALVAYSVRALSSAWLEEPLFTLQKLDGALEPTQEFSSNSEGGAPSAAIATFLGASAGRLDSWKDQTGGEANLVDPAGTVVWALSLQGGKPGFERAPGGAGAYETNVETTSFPNGQCTIFAVCNTDVMVGAILGGAGKGLATLETQVVSLDLKSNTGNREAGGEGTRPPPGIYLWDAAWEYGSRSLLVNGADLPVSDDYDNIGPPSAFVSEVETRWLEPLFNPTSIIIEWFMFPTILTDPQRLAVRQNIAAYYGIALV